MAVVESGPSEVQRVLGKGPIPDPFPTLDLARSDADRQEKIRQIRKVIDDRGIKYIFFQQVSISGHVNGKGVVATQWEKVAQEGYQLVYGATADLFVDRQDRYIGFGPEESELAAIADLDTFAQHPWDERVARVFCDCYDTETGKPLEADPRQNLKRITNEVEQELGYTFLCGIEPEMMWMSKTDDPNDAQGLTKPRCYHINQFEELRETILDVTDYGERTGTNPTYGDHEDSPGQLELNFLFDRAVRTADSLSTYRPICAAVARKHGVIASFMPKPFTGVSANGAHHHFTLVDEAGNNVFYDTDGPAKLSEIGLQFMGGILDHYRGLCGITASTVNSYKRFWDFGFWAPIYKDYGWQNRTTLVRVASGGRSTPARRSSATSTTCWRRAARFHACPNTWARRFRRSRRTKSCAALFPAVSTMCTCTTSATSGSSTWPPSPTGSGRSTWTCSPNVRNRRDHLSEWERRPRSRPRHDGDAAVDEAPRPRLHRLRALRAGHRARH